MARMDYYLVLTMIMSMLWGIFVVMLGAIIRFGIGQIIGTYVKDVKSVVRLEAAINKVGQNICPVETSPLNNINIGEWAIMLGAIVIVIGMLIILFSGVGFFAGLKHSNLLLMFVVVAILVAISLQYYLFQVFTDKDDNFHRTAEEQMIDILHAEYELETEVNMFSNTINAIMLTAQCCGIQGPRDFNNLTFVDRENDNEEVFFKVSPACCKRELFNTDSNVAFPIIKECAISGLDNSNNINIRGCYLTVFDHVNENYGSLITVGIVSLSIWELMQLILAIAIIFTPPPRRHESRRSSYYTRPSAEVEVGEKKRKKFVPFSKVSSFQADDLTRIRSTEIW